MKKLVDVNFEWVADDTFLAPHYTLSTKIGNVSLPKVTLFADKRGFYDAEQTPIEFTKDLEKAKRKAENSVLKQLKLS